MSEREIKQFIREEYGLHHHQKIRKIDLEKKQFRLLIGDCVATIPFGKKLMRELNLEALGI